MSRSTGRTGAVKAVVALPIAALLLAAPAAALPTHKPKEACDLLKRSEIAETLGEDTGKPQELGIEDSSCFWELESAGGGGMTLLVDRGRDAKPYYDEYQANFRPELLIEVDGLGKKAFFVLDQLGVLKSKKTAFYVSGVFDQAQAEALAEIVLERL
jgi:hypothetical protein